MSGVARVDVTLTAGQVRRLLETHGIRPTKGLGQNFVADPNTVRRVVRLARVDEGSRVVEIGAGLGSLTLALAEAGAQVLAVEVDRRLAEVARQVTSGRDVQVVEGDALTLDWSEALGGGERWSLVANLPYNVATPVIVRILEEVPQVESLTVMVQREVGERLVARPRSSAYGAVSVKVAWWAVGSLVGTVPPSVFVPRPKVSSVLVRLERRVEPPVEVPASYERIFSVVRAGFAHRRKMLRRALAGILDPAAFTATGISEQARAEELDVGEWAALAAWTPPS